MFVHSDRLPAGPAVPQGAVTPVPWGISRMAPYPTTAPGHTTARLDAETQTARFFDAAGRALEMGGHGTSTGTSPATGTSPDGNGTTQDQDSGSDADQ